MKSHVSWNSRSVSPGNPTMTSAQRVSEGPAAPSNSETFVCIVPGAVAAIHAAQHGVGSRLKRKVRMTCKLRASIFSHETDQGSVPIHRLNGAQAQSWQIGLFHDRPDQRGECADRRLCWIEVAAPAAKVDSGEHKLVAAGVDEAADMRQDRFGGEAARTAARLGNDAERAAVGTAFPES